MTSAINIKLLLTDDSIPGSDTWVSKKTEQNNRSVFCCKADSW